VQKLVDEVAPAVVQGYMIVDAADMDRNEVEDVIGVGVDHTAGSEVAKVESVGTMGYNLDYSV